MGSVCKMNTYPHPVNLPLLLNRLRYALTVIGHSPRSRRERKAHTTYLTLVGHTSCSYPRCRRAAHALQSITAARIVTARSYRIHYSAFLSSPSSHLSFLIFFQCSTLGSGAHHILYMMHFFHSLLSFFICLALSTSQETVSSLKLPLQRRNTGVSAVQSFDFQWDANVTIGGQWVILTLDTGSSFL